MPEFSFEKSRGQTWEHWQDARKEQAHKQKHDPRHKYVVVHLAGGGFVVERRDK